MKVDAIRRTFYSAKNSLKKLSEQKQNLPYNNDEMLNIPRAQVWTEIKSIAESITNKFAK